MTKKQNNILVFLFILISFLIVLFFYLNFLKIEDEGTIKENNKSEIGKENVVTFTVRDKIYKVSISEGATVYDVMNILQNIKENNFSFISKEYSGLGTFIDEINGIKGVSGKYWVYSVNGEKASVSVSKYILKNGDNVLWEQKEF
jgi:hypothetical protein